MAGSLDFDLARIQAAKRRIDVPQAFKYRPSFTGALVKFLGKVGVRRVQELDVLQFVQVQDELTDRMHQRHGLEFPQLLIELRVAVMCGHLANENVKLLPHGWDSSVKANQKRISFRNMRVTRALRREHKH